MAKGTWVVVDQRDGKIRKVSLELISKARDFGDEVAAVIMGQGIEGLAAEAGKAGADKVYIVDDAKFAQYNTGAYAAQLAAMAKKYDPATIIFGLDEELFNAVVNISNRIPAHQNLQITLLLLAQGRAELEMPIGPEFTNSYGMAHGGIITTLVDSAMGVVFGSINNRVLTLEMNINFLGRVCVGEILRACSDAVHIGSQVVIAQTEVYNLQNQLIAISRGTFFRVGSLLTEE
jgi:uncharacterized protein (TIGR00369 family)